ncbi:MAG: M20/M25/M40 family metallo-hydrolase [Proteobacteria bacterium]|nr:M20/M25/M40 family metallo-hydrolase [Pseudomonadota bacterium]
MKRMWLAGLLLGSTAAIAADPLTIDPARLSDITRTLASEPFQGRAPATPGEKPTLDYIIAQFKQAGLSPAGDNSGWTQRVPLVHTRLGDGRMSVTAGGAEVPLVQKQQIYVSTVRHVDRVAIAKAPMVFVGYGVTAPERQWDDFKGQDLKGKVAVFLVNDPDFEAKPGEPAAGKFGGKAMTFYGRWVYKYQEAARRGAVAALIVHDTPGAGYGWNTVIAPGGENYDIVRTGPDQPVLLQGWIEGEAARDLFRRAGLDLDKLRIEARSPAFKPVALQGSAFSADLPVKSEQVQSFNVLGQIRGAKRPDETVMYGAHWDAYGIGVPDAQGRTIRPGAMDDAIGIAGMVEIARAFHAGPKPDRTIVFAAWTGEERGLLGSEHYAVHPLFPLEKTVANLTMDILQTGGPARDVVLVGPGQSDLEDDLAREAKAQGRTITPETLPERGLFYRADHFSVAKRGVPTLLLMGIAGPHDLVNGGRAAGQKWLDAYMACYHQTCDAWTPDLNFEGAAQDVALLYRIGRELAFTGRWPDWRPSSEFRQVRDKSASQRKRP